MFGGSLAVTGITKLEEVTNDQNAGYLKKLAYSYKPR
jgi:hypothetical protein